MRVRLPYANAFREHEQVYSLTVLTDGEPSPAKVFGSGEGWSVRYSPLSERQMPRDLKKLLYAVTAVVAVMCLYILAAFFPPPKPHHSLARSITVLVGGAIGYLFLVRFVFKKISSYLANM